MFWKISFNSSVESFVLSHWKDENMERNLQKELAAAVTALFLLGSACASVESGSVSRSVVAPKIDFTVTGSVKL
jgi:hypothetical protein